MSLIKTPEQINIMREGGKILADILLDLYNSSDIGTKALDLENKFLKLCEIHDVIPGCKGYTADGYMPPFPTGLCVSINDQSVHCYPKEGVVLRDGDLITIDTVIKHKGMFVDCSFAKGIGNINSQTQKLIETSRGALNEAEKITSAGVKIGLLSHTIQRYVEANGYNVLVDYAGHGIGERMHESPDVPCVGDPNEGAILKSGMTICIESLVCEGKPNVTEVSDWETKMSDGKRFLQFEHTILVTDNGYEILTPLAV